MVDIDTLFNQYITKPTLFHNRSALQANYLPETILHREQQLEQLEELGRQVYKSFQELPPSISTTAKVANPSLQAELDALSLDDTFFRVIGDTDKGGAVVSRVPEPVDFATELNNRIVNLVPVQDLTDVCSWVTEETQTVGIYPEALRQRLRDPFALAGVQRMVPIGSTMMKDGKDPVQMARMPHDGGEPLRRMVRWIVDQSAQPV